MVLGILMTAIGLGAICALLYYCAVFALPVFVGLSAGFWAMSSGAGVGSVVIGFAAGVFIFAIGQVAISSGRSPFMRLAVAFLFAGPAAVAGCSMALELSAFGISSVMWQHVFAVIGACTVGVIAIVRLGNSRSEPAQASACRKTTIR